MSRKQPEFTKIEDCIAAHNAAIRAGDTIEANRLLAIQETLIAQEHKKKNGSALSRRLFSKEIVAAAAGLLATGAVGDRIAVVIKQDTDNKEREFYNANAFASNIGVLCDEMLLQRQEASDSEKLANPTNTYRRYIRGIEIRIEKYQKYKFNFNQTESLDSIMMSALVPSLQYAVEHGAGLFISRIVRLYPRFAQDNVHYKTLDGKDSFFNLTDTIKAQYAKAQGSRPDNDFADAEAVIKTLKNIAAVTSVQSIER